jgi:hypothetical protein
MKSLVFVFLCISIHLLNASKEKSELPACVIAEKTHHSFSKEEANPFSRVISIGDVHGSSDGLMIDLFNSNITTSLDSCEWKEQPISTLLVQMGDIVDRGAGAYEAWKCLRKLQSNAHLHSSKVVRLLGSESIQIMLTSIQLQSACFHRS